MGQDVRVGGRLDEQLHPLATGSRVADRYVLVARRDALERLAGRVVHQRLGLRARPVAGEPEVEDRLDAPAGPRRRYGAGGPEPAGRPRAPPRLSDLERLVRGPQRLGHRYRFVRYRPDRQLQRYRLGVD